jgi:hypothetical protein
MVLHKIRRFGGIPAVCGSTLLAGCIPVILPGTQDFSGFEEFEFTGDAICGPDETAYTASIQRIDGERYELALSLVEAGAEGVDDCDPNLAWAGCFVARDLPTRELTGDEAEQMHALFGAVTVETVLWFPLCVTYCETRWARWDSVRLTDAKSCAGFVPYRALSYEQMDEIAAFLESLARDVE